LLYQDEKQTLLQTINCEAPLISLITEELVMSANFLAKKGFGW